MGFNDHKPSKTVLLDGTNCNCSRPIISGESSTIVYNEEPTKNPVAYVAGVYGNVSATLLTDCTQPFYMRATGTDGFDLPPVQVAPSDGEAVYPRTQFTQEFINDKVLYYPEFSLTWSITFDDDPNNSDSYMEVGTTNFLLYVTHNRPLENINSGPFEWSLIDIACRGSHNMTSPYSVSTTIYDDFEDTVVFKVEEGANPMRYWGGNTPANLTGSQIDVCFSYKALIAYNDATCGAWADLYSKCNAIHGIDDEIGMLFVAAKSPNPVVDPINFPISSGAAIVSSTNPLIGPDIEYLSEYVQKRGTLISNFNSDEYSLMPIGFDLVVNENEGPFPGSYNCIALEFLVNKWDIQSLPFQTSFMLSERQSGQNADIVSTPDSFVPPQTISFTNGQSIPYLGLLGESAQGNENPYAQFTNHALYARSGRILDPSYGSGPFANQNAWEGSSLSGYGFISSSHYA